MDYGYARVSTKEQNEQRQIIALTQFGLSEMHLCGQAIRKRFRAAAVPAAGAQTERRRYACRQEYRPSGEKLYHDIHLRKSLLGIHLKLEERKCA